jgi:hypothetical protein
VINAFEEAAVIGLHPLLTRRSTPSWSSVGRPAELEVVRLRSRREVDVFQARPHKDRG